MVLVLVWLCVFAAVLYFGVGVKLLQNEDENFKHLGIIAMMTSGAAVFLASISISSGVPEIIRAIGILFGLAWVMMWFLLLLASAGGSVRN